MVAKVEERKQNDPEKIVTYEKSKIFFFPYLWQSKVLSPNFASIINWISANVLTSIAPEMINEKPMVLRWF